MLKYLIVVFFSCLGHISGAQTIRLHYSGNNSKISAAIVEANRILQDSSFYNRIDTIAHFDNTNYTGHQIVTEFKSLNRVIEVSDYWRPIAWANAKTVSMIRINKAKLNRSHSSITNTLIHETVHAVDWLTNEDWNYTHDGNSPEGQDMTAPWIIGAVAESMIN